jgi:hypothetical protein
LRSASSNRSYFSVSALALLGRKSTRAVSVPRRSGAATFCDSGPATVHAFTTAVSSSISRCPATKNDHPFASSGPPSVASFSARVNGGFAAANAFCACRAELRKNIAPLPW